jgi:hypothetical protein
MPLGTSLSWNSLLLTTARSSALMRSRIACGSARGREEPGPVADVHAANPASFVVGIDG